MRTEELLALGIFGRGSRLTERIEMLLVRGRVFSQGASMGRVATSGILLFGCAVAGAFAPRLIAFAQERPKFEVASVKPTDPNNHLWRAELSPGGRFTATNYRFQDLVQRAYSVKRFQISGVPSWGADPFDIAAKAGGATGEVELRLMLQSLLADRFKLKLHRETKEGAVYALGVGKNPPRVREVTDDITKEPPVSVYSTHVKAHAASMRWLSDFLTDELEIPVVNRTGLTGSYAWELMWDPSDPEGPSLITAVQEQLGLRVEKSKGPIEMLVIDHVEKPNAN